VVDADEDDAQDWAASFVPSEQPIFSSWKITRGLLVVAMADAVNAFHRVLRIAIVNYCQVVKNAIYWLPEFKNNCGRSHRILARRASVYRRPDHRHDGWAARRVLTSSLHSALFTLHYRYSHRLTHIPRILGIIRGIARCVIASQTLPVPVDAVKLSGI
jgi:hypothetical protein